MGFKRKGSGTRETFDRVFKNKQSKINIKLELEHTEAIKRAVESSVGIGCISRLALKDELKTGSLIALEVKNVKLDRYFNFLWSKNKYQTNGVRQFLKMCTDMTKGIQRSDQIDLPLIV